MTTSEAFEPFINFCRAERHVSDSTLAKYQDCFRVWLFPYVGDRAVAEISRPDVLSLRQAMVARPLSIARQYSVIMASRVS